jgi:hypothetical protein
MRVRVWPDSRILYNETPVPMLSTRPAECLAGDDALARGAWAEAREAFEETPGARELPEALEGLRSQLLGERGGGRMKGYNLALNEPPPLGKLRCVLSKVSEALTEIADSLYGADAPP